MEQQRGLATMTTLLYNVMQQRLCSVNAEFVIVIAACCGKDMFHMWLRRGWWGEEGRVAVCSGRTPTHGATDSTALWLKSTSSLACSPERPPSHHTWPASCEVHVTMGEKKKKKGRSKVWRFPLDTQDTHPPLGTLLAAVLWLTTAHSLFRI